MEDLMELFTQEGGALASRWLHIVSGVTWIGLLYYFNFVQVPAFAGFEAAARTEAITKLVPRALWWFRWGAVATVATGLLILGFQEQFDGDYFKTPQGISISLGMGLGIIMFLNVWGVIWRNQKTVIASAQGVAEGRPADPAAADAGRKALLASRTNAIFSIPLLFFMAFTSHLAPIYPQAPESSDRLMFWLPVLAVVALFELNALGVIGGFGPSPMRKYLETHRNSIITGFVLFALFYLWFEVTLGS
ncbi:MAG TPA: hypothetical protein VMZ22_01250 [Acidimicrobiales bacterium]|nr:hypothetical protein [Acidimicrobiales bacterium]